MKDFQEFTYHAWLASARIPPDQLMNLLDIYKTPEGCFQGFRNNRSAFTAAIPPACIRILDSEGNEERLLQFSELLKKNRIRSILYSDQDYPEQLKQLADPPVILFYQGRPDCMSGRILAMVGSRAASYAGQQAARRIARDLSSRGVQIISGLACGIDASAHRGCLDGGSPTIAVMGCGLDRMYPAVNWALKNEILEKGGLILSEYAPGEKPAGWHFPVRNRIITGLSGALILIEARIRSGSMTSVHHALDQGKDVFVYPGDPASDQYEGNHQLLREGALYFTTADDILEDLGWLDNHKIIRQNIDCSAETVEADPEEAAVIQALKPGKLSFEQLLSFTGLNASALMAALTILQVRGKIEALPGKQYQLKL